MKHPRRWTLLVAMLALLGLTVACLPDRFSWSPDGRQVAYPDDQAPALWIWDATSGASRKLPLSWADDAANTPTLEKIECCTWLPGGRGLVAMGAKQGAVQALLRIELPSGRATVLDRLPSPGDDASLTMVVGRKGAIYYLRRVEGREAMELLRVNARGRHKRLARVPRGAYLSVSPSERQAVLLTDDALCLVNLDRGTTRGLPAMFNPVWIDDARLVGTVPMAEGAPGRQLDDGQHGLELGQLLLLTVDDGTTAALAQHIHPWIRPSVRPDGGSVLVTAARLPAGGCATGLVKVPQTPQLMQVEEIDLRTGAARWLTDEPFGALFPRYSPTGERLVYQSAVMLNVLERASGKATPQPRDEAEQAFVAAEKLLRDGQPTQALAAYEALARHPRVGQPEAAKKEGGPPAEATAPRAVEDAEFREDLREACAYRRFQLLMRPECHDVRGALELLKTMDESHALQALGQLAEPPPAH